MSQDAQSTPESAQGEQAQKARQSKDDESANKAEQAAGRAERSEQRTEWAEQRTEWAEQRTEWAQHRSLLANERNFSAWIRTGLSSIAGGLAVARFLGGEDANVIARIVGVILVVLGAGVCVLALWRHQQISKVLEKEGLHQTPSWAVWTLVGGLLLAAALVLVLVFVQ